MKITKNACFKASQDEDLRSFVGEIDNFIVDKCIELRDLIGSRDGDLYSGIMCLMVAGNMTTKVLMATSEDEGANEVFQEFTKNHAMEMINKIQTKINNPPQSAQEFMDMLTKLMSKVEEGLGE